MGEIAGIIWAVAGLVASVSFGIYLWRRPDASVRVSHKGSEIALEPRPTSIELPKPPAIGAGAAAPEAPAAPAPPSEAAAEVEAKSQDAFRLLRTGSYAEGMKLLRQEASEKPDMKEQVSLIAFGQLIAADHGSEEALKDLRTLASEHKGLFEPQLWLGAALRRTCTASEAEQAFLAAFEVAESDDDRATALVWRFTEIVTPGSEIARASELLALSTALVEPHARARVAAAAAKLFLGATPPDRLRGFALYELALALNPSDKSLRFDVGYAYSGASAHTGALLHYSDLLEREPANQGAMNNLGVAEAGLELPASAVDHYKDAEETGNTLAAANLAWVLIHSGFLAEARTRLDEALKAADPHRNVLDALGGIARRRNEEDEKRKTLLDRERRIAHVRYLLGEALASGVPTAPEAGGLFSSEEGSTLRLDTSDAGEVTGILDSLLLKRSLVGWSVGGAVVFDWTTPKPADSTGLLSFLTRSGHGVLVLEGNSLRGFTYDGDERPDVATASDFEEWTFTRAAVTAKAAVRLLPPST